MRNFLNFMGKSLMVLVFSFLTLSVVLTSCSSDDSSEEITQVDLNNLGLDPTYVPDENDPDSYVRRGTSTPIVLLSLEGTEFTFSENSELVTLGSGGKTLVSSVSQNTQVGSKTITYNVLRNGTSVGSRTLEFDVYYGGSDVQIFDTVTATILDYSNTNGTFTPSTTITLKDIPYQYLVNSDNRYYQLCFDGETITASNFDNSTGNISEWRIVKLSLSPSQTFNQNYVVPRNVRYKEKSNIRFYELRVNGNTGEFIDNDTNLCRDYPTGSSTVLFGCDTI